MTGVERILNLMNTTLNTLTDAALRAEFSIACADKHAQRRAGDDLASKRADNLMRAIFGEARRRGLPWAA